MRGGPILLLLCLGACASTPPMPLAATGAPGQARDFVVFFPEWSAAINGSAATVIRTAATTAEADPNAHILVTGFADPVGSVQANAYLTQLRAQVVADQLQRDGLPPNRIQQAASGSVGYVETRQESRRVVISVSR